MKLKSSLTNMCIVFIAFSLFGCSNFTSPVTTDSQPDTVISNSFDTLPTTGILGAYDLKIDPETMTGDLVPMRTSAIGESFLVNGLVVFIMEPCRNCLRLKTIDLDDENNVIVTFVLDHPFPKGDPTQDPTAVNRLDLDIFDTAMLVRPQGGFVWTIFDVGRVFANYCVNPDGYTSELTNVFNNNSALPYFLVVDESNKTASTHDWNRFEMGTLEHEFDIVLANEAKPWTMELFLTMGYGASAKKFTRFEPKYYNPEFNKKNAWKIAVTPPEGDAVPDETNTWVVDDTTTTFPVTVEVWDWQQGAIVSTEENFKDALANQVYAASNVLSVELEIPGMFNNPIEFEGDPTGMGKPGNPLIYVFDVANTLNLPEGEYTGAVKVTDEREPSILLPPDAGRDILIHSVDGLSGEFLKIPEYATYQTFTATVVPAPI